MKEANNPKIYLRPLKEEDAPFMLEWMHTDDIVYYFQHDFQSYDLEKVCAFIRGGEDDKNIHRAIVDELGEYLGTVSLKNIDTVNKNAEYAIVLRKRALGKGVAAKATEAILRLAFEDLLLNKVYLNVLEENKRAIAFYEKYGFFKEGKSAEHIFHKGKCKDIFWYCMLKKDWDKRKAMKSDKEKV